MTVLEVLKNAEYNLQGKMDFQKQIGLEQLKNAIEQLEENSDAEEEYVEK